MHFWIDKRSQGCGFNGRYLVPPSISGSRRNQRLLWGGFHPKLMVTPVHRFQSITNVASGGVRHPRAPGYQARITLQCHNPVQINASSSSNARSNTVNQSIDLLSTGHNASVTPHNVSNPTAKLKCGVWAFFAILTFFIAGAKFYFHGGNMGMEALAFCSLLVVILLVGGLVSLYEAISSTPNSTRNAQNSVQISSEQNETNEETSNQVPNNVSSLTVMELPPPPYHIAVMLPAQTGGNEESITILRDSPPPSYDKAVT